MQPHIANTKITTVQAHEEREKVLNAHMMMWTIVLGPQKRTANHFQAWNNDILALCGLRKDHKVITDPIAGPPTRPVCGANIASNYRISYFLSMIIRPIIRMSPDVCDSAEDLSRINDCNNTCDLTGCMYICHEIGVYLIAASKRSTMIFQNIQVGCLLSIHAMFGEFGILPKCLRLLTFNHSSHLGFNFGRRYFELLGTSTTQLIVDKFYTVF
ncbi:Hypothetical predicted protein [Octopus vulgaris]|uniref:Uncharacterized protein n=1 Tax=Octopus vulgaris TaxID=6645 RepID=A0AA36F2R0_OCTVU|nr:Hypothetical predicted protein [Octopus vulgaris]